MIRSQRNDGVICKTIILKILKSIFKSIFKLQVRSYICSYRLGIIKPLLLTPGIYDCLVFSDMALDVKSYLLCALTVM